MSHFSLKCTKSYFGWGSAPDPAGGGSLQRSPRSPIAGFQEYASKGREGAGRGLSPLQRFTKMTPLPIFFVIGMQLIY